MSGFPPVGKYNLGDVYTNRYGESRILGYDYQMVNTPAQTGGAKTRKSPRKKSPRRKSPRRKSPAKRKLRGRKTWLKFDNDQFQKMAAIYLTFLRGRRGAPAGVPPIAGTPILKQAIVSDEPGPVARRFTKTPSPKRSVVIEELPKAQRAVLGPGPKPVRAEIRERRDPSEVVILTAKDVPRSVARTPTMRVQLSLSDVNKDLESVQDVCNELGSEFRGRAKERDLVQISRSIITPLVRKYKVPVDSLKQGFNTSVINNNCRVIIRQIKNFRKAIRDKIEKEEEEGNAQLEPKPLRTLRAVHRDLDQVDRKIERLESQNAEANSSLRKSAVRKARAKKRAERTQRQLEQEAREEASNQEREQKVQSELRELEAKRNELEREEAQVVQWQTSKVYRSPANEARNAQQMIGRAKRRKQTKKETRKRLKEKRAGQLIKEKESYEEMMEEPVFQENPLYQAEVVENLRQVDDELDRIDEEIEKIEEELPEDPANISNVRKWLEDQKTGFLKNDADAYQKACQAKDMNTVRKIREIYRLDKGGRGDCTKNRIKRVRKIIMDKDFETIRQRKDAALREGMQRAQATNIAVQNIALSSNVESAFGSPKRSPLNPLGLVGF